MYADIFKYETKKWLGATADLSVFLQPWIRNIKKQTLSNFMGKIGIFGVTKCSLAGCQMVSCLCLLPLVLFLSHIVVSYKNQPQMFPP